MASEIQYRHTATGRSLYAILRNREGKVWNGTAFVTMATANWTIYALALAETPAGGYEYVADFPVAILTPGDYPVDLYDRTGASPALTDARISSGAEVLWSGTAELSLSSLFASSQAAAGGVSPPSAGAV